MKLLLALAAGLAAAVVGRADYDEEKIAPADLPKPVAALIQKKFPNGEMKSAKKEKAKSHTEYEVTVEAADAKIDVNIHDHGPDKVFIHSFEKTVPTDKLPEKIAAALKSMHPTAKLVKVEEVYLLHDPKDEHIPGDPADPAGVRYKMDRVAYYEIDVTVDGKEKEVKINNDGTPHKDADDHDHANKPKKGDK